MLCHCQCFDALYFRLFSKCQINFDWNSNWQHICISLLSTKPDRWKQHQQQQPKQIFIIYSIKFETRSNVSNPTYSRVCACDWYEITNSFDFRSFSTFKEANLNIQIFQLNSRLIFICYIYYYCIYYTLRNISTFCSSMTLLLPHIMKIIIF